MRLKKTTCPEKIPIFQTDRPGFSAQDIATPVLTLRHAVPSE
jgi:hypothetical protein